MKSNLLILSFEPFNKESTNGKTLWSMIEGLQFDFNISQIFIKNFIPNVSGNYRSLLVNEENIIKPFISPRKIIKRVDTDLSVYNTNKSDNISKKPKKSALTMIIRNLSWYLIYLKFKFVFKWIEEEKPDYLFIFDSDLPFFNFFARKIKKKYNCKLIFYTSENYSLKQKNYMNGKYDRKLIFLLFKNILFKSYKKLFKHTNKEIFLTRSLLEEYSEHYHLNSPTVIYPSSEVERFSPKSREEKIIFSYCGGLGVGRWETLVIFLKTIEKFNNIKIIIASNISNEKEKEILRYKIVDYRGYVSFEEVLNIYKESDVILHFESFDELIAADCKHAFSGKIADCISSGRPFLYFGPSKNAISNFLYKNNCGFQINEINKLNSFINKIIADNKYTYLHYNNAKITSDCTSQLNVDTLIT